MYCGYGLERMAKKRNGRWSHTKNPPGKKEQRVNIFGILSFGENVILFYSSSIRNKSNLRKKYDS